MNTKHLDLVKSEFDKTVNLIVEEFGEIAEELQEPDLYKRLTANDIICAHELKIWKKVFEIVEYYSGRFGNFSFNVYEIDKECIEAAIAQYKKQMQAAHLLEEMEKELRAIDYGDCSHNSYIELI